MWMVQFLWRLCIYASRGIGAPFACENANRGNVISVARKENKSQWRGDAGVRFSPILEVHRNGRFHLKRWRWWVRWGSWGKNASFLGLWPEVTRFHRLKSNSYLWKNINTTWKCTPAIHRAKYFCTGWFIESSDRPYLRGTLCDKIYAPAPHTNRSNN